MKFQSKKLFDGYSTCFRQHRAEGTHCSFLHGYAVSFEVTFEGDLDEKNWVFDFGGMKRAVHKINDKTPTEFFSWLLDHTVIAAESDPEIESLKLLDDKGVIQLRILPEVGCELFAKYLYDTINKFLIREVGPRVKAVKVEVRENNKNSASYGA